MKTRYGKPIPTFPDIETHVSVLCDEKSKVMIRGTAFCYARFEYKGKWYTQEFAYDYYASGDSASPESATKSCIQGILREIYLNMMVRKLDKSWMSLVSLDGEILHKLDEDQRDEKTRIKNKYLGL